MTNLFLDKVTNTYGRAEDLLFTAVPTDESVFDNDDTVAEYVHENSHVSLDEIIQTLVMARDEKGDWRGAIDMTLAALDFED